MSKYDSQITQQQETNELLNMSIHSISTETESLEQDTLKDIRVGDVSGHDTELETEGDKVESIEQENGSEVTESKTFFTASEFRENERPSLRYATRNGSFFGQRQIHLYPPWYKAVENKK